MAKDRFPGKGHFMTKWNILSVDPASLPRKAERRLLLLLSLLAGLGTLAVTLYILIPLTPVAPTWEEVKAVIPTATREAFRPEPLERFLYVTGLLLLPLCLGGAYLGSRRLLRTGGGVRIAAQLAPVISGLMAPPAILLALSAGLGEERMDLRAILPGSGISLAIAIAVSLTLAAASADLTRFRERVGRALTVPLRVLAGIFLLAVFLFTLLGPEHIRNAPIFAMSFNAVFHSVVQVWLGKGLLVDFVNQYGLYPHFIEPILRLVGLSVYSFTALMGLLTCLAYACLYRFLAAETGDELLSFLGLTAMLFFGYVAFRVALPDLYLQFHPIRIIFPALSIPLARAFILRPSGRLATALAALGTVAFLWNPDTGLVVLAAAFLLPVFDSLVRRRPREIPARLLGGFAAAAAVLAFFTVYLRLRYGGFPDYSRLFNYFKVFYLFGMNMLPMPRYGIWVPVLGLYATGLLVSMAALLEGDERPRARLYFYLSVLGLGLFTYYQGRSVLSGLMAVSYPAVVLLVLLADDLRRQACPRGWASDRILSGSLLAFVAFSVPALATVAPAWVRHIDEKIHVSRQGSTDTVLRDGEFLRRHLRPGEEVLIMSLNSGLYHLMTRTVEPLDIPGTSEIVYRREFEKRRAYILGRGGIVVIDKIAILRKYVDEYRRLYPVSLENPDGTLIILRPS
jgi:hypothetical protein